MLCGLYDIFQHWGEKNAVWVIADTHFGDAEVHIKNPERPSDEELIKKLNMRVGKNGTLILLGDVGDIECAKRLRGYKVLIQGNHDRGKTIYKDIFDEVYEGALIIGEKIILSHEPIVGLTNMINLHGHVHSKSAKNDKYHFNLCCDNYGYEPLNFTAWLKDGGMSKIQSAHRDTIIKATKRKEKRK